MGGGQMTRAQAYRRAARMFRDGSIVPEAEAYCSSCRRRGGDKQERFPNLAGFSRYMGIGLCSLRALGERHAAVYDAILTLLEDEALNATRYPCSSSTLTATYLRERLGAFEHDKTKDKGAASSKEAEMVKVVFEHDMAEDGR